MSEQETAEPAPAPRPRSRPQSPRHVRAVPTTAIAPRPPARPSFDRGPRDRDAEPQVGDVGLDRDPAGAADHDRAGRVVVGSVIGVSSARAGRTAIERGSGVDDDVDRAAPAEELRARPATPAVDQQVDRVVADRQPGDGQLGQPLGQGRPDRARAGGRVASARSPSIVCSR